MSDHEGRAVTAATGGASTGSGTLVFVKVSQSWAKSPLSHEVPEPLRSTVAPLLPWRTEPDLYLSDLRNRLPAGLTVPRAFGVFVPLPSCVGRVFPSACRPTADSLPPRSCSTGFPGCRSRPTWSSSTCSG